MSSRFNGHDLRLIALSQSLGLFAVGFAYAALRKSAVSRVFIIVSYVK